MSTKRSRYYQSMLDLNMIGRGSKYKNLKTSFVIFICTFDLFGKGRVFYTFENLCTADPSLKLEDKAYKVFVNSEGDTDGYDENVRAFVKYLKTQAVEDEFCAGINREVKKVRTHEGWKVEYMTLEMKMDEIREEEMEKRFRMLKTMIQKRLITEEEAIENEPEKERFTIWLNDH